jgi:hypothetical protein
MAQLLGGTRIYGNATIDAQLVVNGTTSATSTNTGALVVTGGIGIGGSVYSPLMFENSARIVSTSTIKFYAATSVQNGTDTVITLSTTTGQLTVWNTSTLQSITSRGATTDRVMTITNITLATSTNTGALQVRGGVGIGQTLFVRSTASFLDRIIATPDGSVQTYYLPEFATNFEPGIIGAGTSYRAADGAAWMALGQWSASTSDSGGAYISLNKSNSSPVGTHAAILPNQRVGAIGFAGSDGSMFVGLADIYGESDGVVAANNIPGRLIFATNTGRLNPVEQMRLDSAGRLGINTTAPTSLLHVDGTALITGITTVSNVSVSNSTTTGALVVTGGVGIGGNLHVGGEIVAQKLTIQLTTITTTMVQTDDIIKTLNTTAATNTTTGALQVTGGAGIGGNIYVGGQIAVATITSISGDITIDPNGNSNVVFGTGAQVKILDTTLSSSTATGALVVSGGMGVAEDIYVGGQIAVATITSIISNSDITIDPNGTGNVVFGTGAQVKILDTTVASSTTTGALVVSGGMGVAEDIYVGGQIAVSTITSILGDITIDPNGNSNVVFGTGAQVKILDTTAASSTITGALVVSGGMGVAEDIYVGGQVNVTSTTDSASITTGALVVSGGAGFSKNLYVGGQIAVSTITSISGNITIDPNGVSDVVFGTGAQVKINDVTGSTTTATGALVVSGGLGVAQNLYVGGEVKFGSPQGSALRHVTNGYTNGSQIFVSTSTPTASAVGDIWIKI